MSPHRATHAASAEAHCLAPAGRFDELIEVVRRLEAGGTTLEESLALWERGEELAKVCRHWLEGARARLDAALARPDERAGGAPQDGQD